LPAKRQRHQARWRLTAIRSVIGWCSVGPRSAFPALQRSRVLQIEHDEHMWSITCFYVRSGYRGRGVATLLAKEAIRVAARHGATAVEGYPAVPYDKKRPMPAAFAWTGVPAIFERLRFSKLRRRGRPIYRVKLNPAAR